MRLSIKDGATPSSPLTSKHAKRRPKLSRPCMRRSISSKRPLPSSQKTSVSSPRQLLSLTLIDLRMQGLDSFGLLFACLLVSGELGVTPSFMLSFLVGFFHQADDEILDHLLNLVEGIVSCMCCQCCQDTAVELLSTGCQV